MKLKSHFKFKKLKIDKSLNNATSMRHVFKIIKAMK